MRRAALAAGWLLVAGLVALWLYTTSLAVALAGVDRRLGLAAGVLLGVLLAVVARPVFARPVSEQRSDRNGEGAPSGPDTASSSAGWIGRVRAAWATIPPAHRWALGAVVAVGIVLRVEALFQPIRHDEAYSYLVFASRDLAEALSTYPAPNNHLLNTLLVGAVGRWLGDAEPLLRLPALLPGLLVPPATYWVGLELWDRRTALLGAALTAVSPVLVLFATNARGHSLVVLGFLALVASGTMLRRDPGRPGPWIALVVTAALGGYAVPVFLYPFGGVCLWLALEFLRGGPAWRALGKLGVAVGLAGVVALGLWAPVLVEEGLEAVIANRVVEARAAGAFASALPSFLGDLARQWSEGLPTPLVIAAGLALGIGALSLGDRGRRWMAAGVFGWAAALLLATRRAEYPRMWLYLLPLASLAAGAGLARIVDGVDALAGEARRPTLAVALSFVLLYGGGWVLVEDSVRRMTETGSLPHGDEVAAWLAEHVGPEDGVRGALPSTLPLAYYLARDETVSVRALRRTPSRAVYLVVNEAHGQDLYALLGEADLSAAHDARATRVFSRRGVAVYRVPL